MVCYHQNFGLMAFGPIDVSSRNGCSHSSWTDVSARNSCAYSDRTDIFTPKGFLQILI